MAASIDQYGVTFADALKWWSLIRRMKRHERVHGPWMEMRNTGRGWNALKLRNLNAVSINRACHGSWTQWGCDKHG